jgi:hypothetical protein
VLTLSIVKADTGGTRRTLRTADAGRPGPDTSHPFEPHRLPLSDLEYTTMKTLEERLADRWQPLPAVAAPVRG